jgi:hypothetical protein
VRAMASRNNLVNACDRIYHPLTAKRPFLCDAT